MIDIRQIIVEAKIYIQRSSLYLSIINSFMIAYIFTKNAFPKVNMAIYGVPIIIGTIILFLLIGYLDDKMKIFTLEFKANNARNPEFLSLHNKLDKLLKVKK